MFLDNPSGKGDLFPKGTSIKQITKAIEKVYRRGTLMSDPSKVMHRIEKRIRVNGEIGNYRLLVDTKNKEVISFFKVNNNGG